MSLCKLLGAISAGFSGRMTFIRHSCGVVFFDSAVNALELTVSDSLHLLIRQGKILLENHSLVYAADRIRAICKGDSMLFMCRVKPGQTRRFRVKFASSDSVSGERSCKVCVDSLSKYVPFKRSESSTEQDQSDPAAKEASLPAEIPMADMAELLTGPKSSLLPQAYRQTQSLPPDQLSLLVGLCLSDVNFPTFVEQVEEELNKIKNISST